MRKLKRTIAKNFMHRAGIRNVNRRMRIGWRDYLAEALKHYSRLGKRSVQR